jgi:hypothetical protein
MGLGHVGEARERFVLQAVPVVLTVQGLSNIATASLSYNRPVVTSITPNSSDTEGGVLVTVFGNNFGEPEVPLTVTLVRGAGVEYSCEVLVSAVAVCGREPSALIAVL